MIKTADYTMTVYDLMQNNFDFGLNDYEIFDEEYRPILNNAILEYYKFREIGFQNPCLWRDRLRRRLDYIMRNKYNALYKAKLIEFNPLFNVDMTETFTHETSHKNNTKQTGSSVTNGQEENNTTNDRTMNAERNTENEGLNITSQYPSDEMVNNDLSSNVFVDNALKQTSTNSDTETTTDKITQVSKLNNSDNTNVDNKIIEKGKEIETYTRTNKGSSAGLPFSKAMLQFKEFVMQYDLDGQVINELKDLFMTIWEV